MAPILCEAVLPSTTGRPEDAVINTFAWLTSTSPASNSELTDIGVFMTSFYNNVRATTFSVASFLGTQLSRAALAAHFKLYDLTGAEDGRPHGSPIRDITWTLGNPTPASTNLPSEIAVVLSFHSLLTDFQQELGDTRPAARRRGRVYLGPVNSGALNVDATSHIVSVSTLCRDTISQAGDAMLATPTAQWAQWSRANLQLDSVTGGFVDNAFDSQRRRGESATLRTVFGGP
jgi:hypothetical protein